MNTHLCGYIIGRVFYPRKVSEVYGVRFFLLPAKEEALPRKKNLTGVRKFSQEHSGGVRKFSRLIVAIVTGAVTIVTNIVTAL